MKHLALIAAALWLGGADAPDAPPFVPSMIDGHPAVLLPGTPICETVMNLREVVMGGPRQGCIAFPIPIPASLDRPLKDALPLDHFTFLLPGNAVVQAWTVSKALVPKITVDPPPK